MENNHTIHSFKFDLLQLGKQKHTEVEQRVIRTFNQSFYNIINRISDRFAIDEDLALSQLVLDLGDISEDEIERQLPYKFEEALLDYFKRRERLEGNQKQKEETQEQAKLHPLLFYLFYGVYPWYAKQEETFTSSWEKNILEKEFKKHIYQYTWPQRAIKRLVHLGFEQLLKKTVKALVPQEATFIFDYHQELLSQREQEEMPQNESRRSYHYIIWEFTLQYILNAKGSRFSRKQFVMTQMSSIASHYNIRLTQFIELFFKGIKELKVQNQHQKELYSILTELQEEYEKSSTTEAEMLNKIKHGETVLLLGIHDVERLLKLKLRSSIQNIQLKNWLSKKRNLERIKLNWLNPLKENILYESLSVLVGKESKEQIKNYHELLWEQRSEADGVPILTSYKQAVWEFTLDFFAQSFSSYFQAKEFIRFHSKKMAQRYNFSLQVFLSSLVTSLEKLGDKRTHFKFLTSVLLSVYDEENNDNYKDKRTQDQLVNELLNQAISEYENASFLSEREVYFFLEKWAIRIIDETNVLVKLPLSYLLTLLKSRKQISSSFLKEVIHHQQYELLYQGIKENGAALKEPPLKLISKINTEPDINDFISGSKTLTFQLLLKILLHQQQISFVIMEQLRLALRQEQLREKLIQKWALKLNFSEFIRLLALLFPNSKFLIEVYTILYYALNMNRGKMASLVLSKFFEWGDKINARKIWEKLLITITTADQIALQELKYKLANKVLEMASQNTQLIAHYNYLVDHKQYFGIESSREKQYDSEDFSIEIFLSLSESKLVEFSESQKIEWNDFLRKTLLNQPELWIEQYFRKYGSMLIKQLEESWLSPTVRNLFLLRTSQWRQIETIVSEQNRIQGEADYFIQFLIRFEEGNYIQAENFILWKDQEIEFLQRFLSDKSKLKNWVYTSQSVKIQFLKRSKIIDQELFVVCYMRLELIYKELPASHKPYTFRDFELNFWSLFILGIKQKWSVWKILEKWIVYSYRSLRVDVAAYGDLKEQLKTHSAKKWQQLEEVIKKEGLREESTESEPEEEIKIEELPLDKWELHHVGLVILHPFFKRLFQGLGYINEKNEFVSKQTQTYAIGIMHYLATGEKYGEDSLEEHELAFPKLLCGMPISELIDSTLVLEAKELEMADDMLKASLQHWDKLKSTSADGLRNTFLKRKGRIEEKDSAYQLYVESSGTDVLLDYLPWSISLIRLPWLELPIYVSWR